MHDSVVSPIRAALAAVALLALPPAARAAWPDAYEGRVAMLDALRHDMAMPDMMAAPDDIAARYTHACQLKSSTACKWRSWQTDAGGDLQAAARALAPRCQGGEPLSCVVVGWAAVLDDRGHYRPDAPGAATARAKFQAACKQGYPAGCTALGELAAEGVGQPADPAAAARLFDEGCKARDPWACYRLGLLARDGRGVERDPARAAGLFERACKADIPHACTALGGLLETGDGVPADGERALALYTAACKARYAGGCTELGRVYAEGRIADPSPAMARGFYSTACEAGDPRACFGMAELAEASGQGVEEAVAIYQRACEAGEAAACGRLGRLWLDGRGVQADPERGLSMLQDACEKGDGASCGIIGARYESGKGLPMNLTRAVKMYQRACNLHDGDGCWSLALLYAVGKGVDRNPARNLALTREACDLGSAEACGALARRFLDGQGVHADPARAAELFDRACRAGLGDACATLGAMVREGKGVQPDPARALALFRRACEADSGGGCFGLGQALEQGAGGDPDYSGALAAYRRACDLGYERGCSASGPITFRARFQELVEDALTSRVCQVWSIDEEDPEASRVLAEVEGARIRPLAGPRQGQELVARHVEDRFDQGEVYTGESRWVLEGEAAVEVTHREVWDPRRGGIDSFPGDAAVSPDRVGTGRIVYSREAETLERRDDGDKGRRGLACRFPGGDARLAAEQCSDIQALLAAQALTACRGE